ncbi:MAG: formylmethanofuran dehydrogenase subunit B [Planctomycetaceae bacterium]
MTANFDQIIDDVTCTQCGCLCDDLSPRLKDGRLVEVQRACSLAAPWYDALASHDPSLPAAMIDGAPAEYAAAITRAAGILANADAPLIYGLSNSSTPGQQAAVALADRLGAIIDTTASTCHAPSIVALQQVGESTASLGEVRQRSDLVIYWGSNPVDSHPRHIERLIDQPGTFVPRGRLGRTVIVIDVEPTATTRLADEFIQVNPGGDFELLCALRACAQGREWQGSDAGGVSRAEVESLALRMQGAQFGAVFFGLGLTRHGIPHLNINALLQLVTDLQVHTRWIARRMRIPGDVAGADSVLCWQTGYPFSVDLARGYPRYNPGEFSGGELLTRGEVDAALFVGSDGYHKLSPAARSHLGSIPTILLTPPHITDPWQATVQFATGTYGVHYAGTAYRMDEVPLPLRPFLPSTLPADHHVLQALMLAVGR